MQSQRRRQRVVPLGLRVFAPLWGLCLWWATAVGAGANAAEAIGVGYFDLVVEPYPSDHRAVVATLELKKEADTPPPTKTVDLPNIQLVKMKPYA